MKSDKKMNCNICGKRKAGCTMEKDKQNLRCYNSNKN